MKQISNHLKSKDISLERYTFQSPCVVSEDQQLSIEKRCKEKLLNDNPKQNKITSSKSNGFEMKNH